MEETKKTIYERLSDISAELETVEKNLEVQVTKNSKYKAVGEAAVLRAVKPLEAKHRVYSFPFLREIIESGTLESTGFDGSVRKQLFERIKTVYRFVNLDNVADYLDITTYGDGIDSGDKSVGKAMTYADKYALLKAYKIVTGDDPDKETNPKNVLLPELLKEAETLGMKLDSVAAYLRKSVDELTNEELAACIEAKKKAIAKKEEKKGEQEQ